MAYVMTRIFSIAQKLDHPLFWEVAMTLGSPPSTKMGSSPTALGDSGLETAVSEATRFGLLPRGGYIFGTEWRFFVEGLV